MASRADSDHGPSGHDEDDDIAASAPPEDFSHHRNAHSPAGTFSGRWTEEEHQLFLNGLEMYGREWKKIAGIIPTRTVVQIRTHAQKYFQRLTKEYSHHKHPASSSMGAAGLGGGGDDDDGDKTRSKKSRSSVTKIRAPSADSQISAVAGGVTPRTVAAASILLAPRHKGDTSAYLQSQANAAALLRRTSPRLSSASSSPVPAWDGV